MFCLKRRHLLGGGSLRLPYRLVSSFGDRNRETGPFDRVKRPGGGSFQGRRALFSDLTVRSACLRRQRGPPGGGFPQVKRQSGGVGNDSDSTPPRISSEKGDPPEDSASCAEYARRGDQLRRTGTFLRAFVPHGATGLTPLEPGIRSETFGKLSADCMRTLATPAPAELWPRTGRSEASASAAG